MDRESIFLQKQNDRIDLLNKELQMIDFFKNVDLEKINDAFKRFTLLYKRYSFLDCLCIYRHLPAWFIRQNKNVLNWSLIKKYQVLCDDFKNEFNDYLKE